MWNALGPSLATEFQHAAPKPRPVMRIAMVWTMRAERADGGLRRDCEVVEVMDIEVRSTCLSSGMAKTLCAEPASSVASVAERDEVGV